MAAPQSYSSACDSVTQDAAATWYGMGFVGGRLVEESVRGLPYTVETAPDARGDSRTGFVFRLRPVGPHDYRATDEAHVDDVTSSPTGELIDAEAIVTWIRS